MGWREWFRWRLRRWYLADWPGGAEWRTMPAEMRVLFLDGLRVGRLTGGLRADAGWRLGLVLHGGALNGAPGYAQQAAGTRNAKGMDTRVVRMR